MTTAPQSDDPVVIRALKRFDLVVEAESASREECLDDLKFSVGEQWSNNIKTIREATNKPTLVMDQITQSIRIVCNEYRQSRPALQINPVGSDSTVDTAEILQGIVRHIEVASDAEIAYDHAHEGVVRNGFGSFRILSDYVDDTGEQEIIIEKIVNPFSVYWQPGVSQEKAKWAFIISDVPRETYEEDYDDFADFTDGIGNDQPKWSTEGYIRVAEYFEVKEVKADGQKKPLRKVIWRKLNCKRVLKEKEIPGTQIPIFTAYGDDLDVNGKRYLAGLVRRAKDPQKQLNWMVSAATQAAALAPTAPWIAVEGSLVKPTDWEKSNTGQVGVLFYRQVDVAGKPCPPPERNAVEPPIQAFAALIERAVQDMKAAMGIYDPSLGQRKGDESGKAIERLQQQGSVATLNFSDNVSRTMRRFGRCLLEWIRAIYDTPRIQRIINPDSTVNQVVIHSGADQKGEAEALKTEAISKVYDIGVGKYDVTVSVGPSYQTKRQEALASMLEFLKILPPQAQMNLLDLVAAQSDWPGAKDFVKRLKMMLPPQFQEDNTDPQTTIMKLQAQNNQLSQHMELMTKALNEATEVVKTKQIEQQGKAQIVQMQEESAQAIEKMKIEAQVTIAEITTKAQSELTRMKFEADIQSKVGMKKVDLQAERESRAHEVAIQAGQQDHEKKLAVHGHLMDAAAGQEDREAEAQGREADQAHEMTMTAVNQGHEKDMSKESMTHEEKMAKQKKLKEKK